MEQTVISLFTSPTCPFCPAAKKVVDEVKQERKDIIVKEFDSGTPEGKVESMKHGIQSVPTIFVQGPKHPEVLGFRGAPSKKRLLQAVDITQGKESLPEKTSFSSKIRRIFS